MDITVAPPSNPADNPFAGAEPIVMEGAAGTEEEVETDINKLEAMYEDLLASGQAAIGEEGAFSHFEVPATSWSQALESFTTKRGYVRAFY
ncbi:hypothetical protein APHAL10511_002271 [Amanita phalloides]|nr:hypothetical protein APHAL10511_002271 [Amanita phalloides]